MLGRMTTLADDTQDTYDVVVLGGGAAGLNGALVLARSRRSVLVVDAGTPRNGPAAGVHGLLGHDGVPPAELLQRGREEVHRYGGTVVRGEVTAVHRADDGFVVTRADGGSVRARRLLVASGLVDELPDIPGLRDRFGHDVLHCPYCHGWEARDRAIGVLAAGPHSVHQALLFRQLSADVTYFTHTAPPLTDGELEQLAARGIGVVGGEVVALETTGDRLTGIRLADGAVVAREVLAVGPRMVAQARFLDVLGLRPVEHPSGRGVHIPTDSTGRTDVRGVWAAGNVTDLGAQVGAAAAAGAFAAAQINLDLVTDDTQAAVRARRAVREDAASAR